MKKLKLKNLSLLVLFLTSYIPLFGLLILRQIKQNKEYLHFSSFDKENIIIAIQKFGLTYFLIVLILFGLFGIYVLFTNFEGRIKNGYLVKIIDIENKNSEAIGYISTYIVPFIFQDTNDFFDLSSLLIVLIIIFLIYSKSNMIVINPILNITHSLYQIEFSQNGIKKKGMLITKIKEIDENQEITINQISNNIFYG